VPSVGGEIPFLVSQRMSAPGEDPRLNMRKNPHNDSDKILQKIPRKVGTNASSGSAVCRMIGERSDWIDVVASLQAVEKLDVHHSSHYPCFTPDARITLRSRPFAMAE
jgi:hypothetical protein